MYYVELYARVRRACMVEGMSVREASRVFGLHRDTVRKMLAYTDQAAAAILGINEGVLNERVREGLVKPVFVQGDRRYSGYVLAGLLGWPLSEDPRDYMPKAERVDSVNGYRRVRRGRSRALA